MSVWDRDDDLDRNNWEREETRAAIRRHQPAGNCTQHHTITPTRNGGGTCHNCGLTLDRTEL